MTSLQEMNKKRRKSQVKVACIACHKKHAACDNHRPCTRCINNGMAETCRDISHKRRNLRSGAQEIDFGSPYIPAFNYFSPDKTIYSLNDLLSSPSDGVIVKKLDEDKPSVTLNTDNCGEYIKGTSLDPELKIKPNNKKEKRASKTKYHQSKWIHTYFEGLKKRQMRESNNHNINPEVPKPNPPVIPLSPTPQITTFHYPSPLPPKDLQSPSQTMSLDIPSQPKHLQSPPQKMSLEIQSQPFYNQENFEKMISGISDLDEGVNEYSTSSLSPVDMDFTDKSSPEQITELDNIAAGWYDFPMSEELLGELYYS